MPAQPRTATTITKTLRAIWPKPARLSTTVTTDGNIQVTTGSGFRRSAAYIGNRLQQATGQTWEFVSATDLRGSSGSIRITYRPAGPVSDTAERADIVEAITILAGRPGGPVRLADLRRCVAYLDTASYVRILLDLDRDRVVQLEADPDRRGLTTLDRATAISRAGRPRHLVRIVQTDTDTPTDTAHPTEEPTLTRATITAAALAAGTEKQCTTTYNCPKRLGHDGLCAKTAFAWMIPPTWTLTNQMQFSRQLKHAARVAADMCTHPSFGGEHMPAMFDAYDKSVSEAGIEQGGTEAALVAYADWINAVVAATAANRTND
jgi:hypothetical protein